MVEAEDTSEPRPSPDRTVDGVVVSRLDRRDELDTEALGGTAPPGSARRTLAPGTAGGARRRSRTAPGTLPGWSRPGALLVFILR